jgi:hypothetical protein
MNAPLSNASPNSTVSGYRQAYSTSPAGPAIERRVLELLPHPGFTKHAVGYSTQEISLLSDRGESAYLNPLTITQDDYIVDGYALWQLAKLQNRITLPCIVRHMSPEESLLHLIEKTRGSKGINDFVRILMALELEPWFKSRAKSNQQMGGREKGSSQLTEADRLDVRFEIARAAGVSAGNVSKVKHLITRAAPELQDALRHGEIRIHRASEWAKTSPTEQRRRLSDHRNERGIHRTIRRLLTRHESRQPKACDGLRDIQKGLTTLQGDDCLSILLEPLSQLISMIEPLLVISEGAKDAA